MNSSTTDIVLNENILSKEEFMKLAQKHVDGIMPKIYNKKLAKYIRPCWEDCDEKYDAKDKLRQRLLKKLEQRKKQQN